MNKKDVTPAFGLNGFICPHCGVYARQYWSDTCANGAFLGNHFHKDSFSESLRDINASKCERCKEYMLWHNETIIYPEAILVEQPNQDLPEDVIDCYNEAASILQKSPRGASALLRLCLQKTCIALGEKGRDINEDIASLVKKGLPRDIQKAMDILRVTGNNAVHPGVIDLDDNPKIAIELFKLINFIAEKMITEPKEVSAFYDEIVPEKNKEQIAKRDQESSRKKSTE